MTKLRGGIFGFGNIGQNVAQYINGRQHAEAQIVAICDVDAAQLQLAREQYGLHATPDMSELAQMDLDFVVVASPNAVHAAQVTAAAAAGKHIFCEKPVALTLADADRMIDAVAQAGVISVVNYSMRYIDGYLKCKALVEDGTLGEILSVWHLMTRGFGLYGSGARHWAVMEPERSGGWTVHHACHSIDFLYWVNGPMTRVYCNTQSTLPDKRSEEFLIGNLTFANGAVGMVGDSTCILREHHTGVVGANGSLLMSGEHGQTVLRLHLENERAERLISAVDSKRPGGGLDHFFQCIRRGQQSPNDLASARHSLAVALAMQESARCGEVVVV